MIKQIEKAELLTEALPYIKEFYGKTVVIKYGGSAMIDEKLKNMVAMDVVLMKYVGITPIIVHGGGKYITKLMERLGKKAIFLNGYRVTDTDTMEITQMVLAGLVNKDVVSLINKHGGNAVGISGKDSKLIEAKKKISKSDASRDYGFVGVIDKINPNIISVLDKGGFIPVISPVGYGEDSASYNVNADDAASAIAKEIKAHKLIYMTDVRGILNDPADESSLLHRLTVSEIPEYINKGIITGGMIPKSTSAADAIEQGVNKIHIIDGRIPHSLLLELFTDVGVGTEIVGS